MSEKLVRDFQIADPIMLTSADSFVEQYKKDEPDFYNHSNIIFAPTFITDFETLIKAARSMPVDNTVVNEVSKETQDVEAIMKLCKGAYIEIKYFAERAFPDNDAIGKQFGFGDYSDAQKSADKMIPFMIMLHSTATKFKAELIAQGYTETKIAAIETLGESLNKERVEQKKAIKERPEKTQNRILILNEVWDKMVDISEAAKIIYHDNYAKLQQYKLPEPPDSGKNKPDNPPDTPQT